jgi:NADPH:quinone reductase
MRVLMVSALQGPDALAVAEVPPPEVAGNDKQVIIDVQAAGVAFADVLMTRGLYQLKPKLPFVPGMEVAGVVRSAPTGADVRRGDRVAAFTGVGGFAEVALAPAHLTFRLPKEFNFAEGAGLILNYHTAVFALVARGRVRAGEQVLVQGAAGGLGTAALQVARGLGARPIAVVSTEEKGVIARRAGAAEVVRSDGDWLEAVRDLTSGGADLVIDPVGGDRFTDNLRALRPGGRAVVLGFAGGSIPEVKVNRLLLNNTEVVGAAWLEWVTQRPDAAREFGDVVSRLISDGAIRPIIGARYGFEDGADALRLVEQRRAVGKVVIDLR